MANQFNSALDLAGHTALITGGGTGVGLGIARVLHACGARVVLVGRSEVHAESAAELGDRAGALAADISVESDCDRVVRETKARWGEPDILVNCAAAKPVSFDGALNQRMEDWQRAMDVSLRGTYQMCRAAGAPDGRERPGLDRQHFVDRRIPAARRRHGLARRPRRPFT